MKGGLQGIGCLGGFFGLFGLAGGALFWFLGIHPLLRAYDARSWAECPAQIVSSTVESHAGSKGGSTYNVAITFDYFFQGRNYRGTHYDFSSGSSSGYEAKREIVDRFPEGARTTCWVNPKNPYDAVIDKGLGWWLMWGLFPLPFLGVGLGGLVFVVAALRAKWKPTVIRASASTSSGAIAPS